MATCLTQPYIQDVFHYASQLKRFSAKTHDAIIWKLSYKPIEETTKFMVVVRIEPDLVSNFY